MPHCELLGICVVYLGGLNYFFPVDEKCPLVSKIGTTDGELHVQITPYINTNGSTAATSQARAVVKPEQDDTNSGGFVRYERQEIDTTEEQVYEYTDRTLQYRVHVHTLHNLKWTRKFSHVYVRYSFFKAGSTQTERQAIQPSLDEDREEDHPVCFQHERRFAVDVNDAFVKYVTSNNLTLEVTEKDGRSGVSGLRHLLLGLIAHTACHDAKWSRSLGATAPIDERRSHFIRAGKVTTADFYAQRRGGSPFLSGPIVSDFRVSQLQGELGFNV